MRVDAKRRDTVEKKAQEWLVDLTLITSRHFKRVIGYARPSDYAHGIGAAAAGPGLLYAMERISPSYVGRGGFAHAMRLAGVIGMFGGFFYFYQRSSRASSLPPSPILQQPTGHSVWSP